MPSRLPHSSIRKLLPLTRFLAALALWPVLLPAQNTVLNYSGKVTVDGIPFNGTGFFAFSIQETNGVTWWSSGAIPPATSRDLIPGSMKLAVTNGVYHVRLGDPNSGMPPLTWETLGRAIAPNLLVWFHDGTRGWHRAGEPIPLATALQSAFKTDLASPASQTETLLRELRALRALYEQQHPSPRARPIELPTPKVTVSIKDAPSLGRAEAPLVLVEFVDFQCPFCKQAQEQVIPDLRSKYIDTGKVRLVFRHLPLDFHPQAMPAARAALCAEQQQQFWPMHDKLFTIANQLSPDNLLRAAQELQLNLAHFQECLDHSPHAEALQNQVKELRAVGIIGTPTFVLGKANGDEVTGELLVGAQPFAYFEKEILAKLAAN